MFGMVLDQLKLIFPQGSILGPNLYMLPLGNIIKKHSISFILYNSCADDYQSSHDHINKLVNCINDMNLWMSRFVLQVNKDKTEALVIGF